MVIPTIDTSSALRELIKQYLEKRGYKTAEGGKILGKSGAEHTFDMLARRDASFANHSIGVCIVPEGDEKTRINFLHNCANRAYDVGLSGSILIVTSPLSDEAQRLAQHQRMRIINGEEVQNLAKEEPARRIKLPDSSPFENGNQLVKALENLNYRVERSLKIKGKSGTE